MERMEQKNYRKGNKEFVERMRYKPDIILDTREVREIKKEIQKQRRKKEKREIALLGVVGSVFLTAVGIGIPTKIILDDYQKQKKNKIEAEMDKGTQYIPYLDEETVEDKIEKTVKKMESFEEVETFLKNAFVGIYEMQTGDTTLTTADIEFCRGENPQSYIYVDKESGDLITHGNDILETEKKLLDNNISLDRIQDVNIYRVKNVRDESTIDAIARINNEYKKVIEGEQYGENKQLNVSILEQMGEIVPKALRYGRNLDVEGISETDMAIVRRDFENAILKVIKDEKNQDLASEIEEGFEL